MNIFIVLVLGAVLGGSVEYLLGKILPENPKLRHIAAVIVAIIGCGVGIYILSPEDSEEKSLTAPTILFQGETIVNNGPIIAENNNDNTTDGEIEPNPTAPASNIGQETMRNQITVSKDKPESITIGSETLTLNIVNYSESFASIQDYRVTLQVIGSIRDQRCPHLRRGYSMYYGSFMISFTGVNTVKRSTGWGISVSDHFESANFIITELEEKVDTQDSCPDL